MSLRKKYRTAGIVKGTRSKTSGNSGGVGRKARAAKRGHGGGQDSPEHKAQRAADRAAHIARWDSAWGRAAA